MIGLVIIKGAERQRRLSCHCGEVAQTGVDREPIGPPPTGEGPLLGLPQEETISPELESYVHGIGIKLVQLDHAISVAECAKLTSTYDF